jgi:prepilin-type processing-associated H-X9-DG protein
VQAAREAARRSQCSNNLKQIGLAWMNHESAQKFLPSGGWHAQFSADPNRGYGKNQPGSWCYSILAYMELAPLHQLGAGAQSSPTASAGFQTAMAQLHTTPLGGFMCPSRRPVKVYLANMPGMQAPWSNLVTIGQSQGVAKTDYAANTGDSYYTAGSTETGTLMYAPFPYDAPPPRAGGIDTWEARCNDPNDLFYQTGVSFYRSEISGRRIEDGTSNTYMVGEKYLGPDQYEGTGGTSTDPAFDWGENQSMYNGFEWDQQRGAWPLNQSRGSTTNTTVIESYQPRQDQAGLNSGSPSVRFGSAHSGGFNMVFCDGSVHFIPYEVDYTVHSRLANRLDGNPATLP